MRLFYDTEFLDDGRTIDLISIGLVADDGREYYAVNADAPWRRIHAHQWLMDNVVPQLPRGGETFERRRSWLVNFYDPLVKSKPQIAKEIKEFVGHTPKPELWAYYAAYDHVVLAQLFGPMSELPDCIPRYTNDLKQELVWRGDPPLPAQTEGQHNALADARWNKLIYDMVIETDNKEEQEDVA